MTHDARVYKVGGDDIYTWNEAKWEEHGEWHSRRFTDGVEQWCASDDEMPRMFIERVHGRSSRRLQWCVVRREPPFKWRHAKYAPKVAGPFPTLEAAQAAYRVIRAAA